MMSDFIAGKLRLAKAHLESARRNLADGDTETATSQAFLAAESAAGALTANAGRRVLPIHDKIRSQFEELCDKGKIPYKFRNILSESYRLRLKADYGRRFVGRQALPNLTSRVVHDMVEKVSDLVAATETVVGTRRSSARR
jgi:HEPN domain-containing protein